MDKLFSVNAKQTLVTGAANGNGFAIAKGFAERGAYVSLLDNDEKGLEYAYKKIKKDLPSSIINAHLVDITKPEQLKTFFRDKTAFDILVNNAGVTRGNVIDEYTEEDWNLTYEVNLKAPFRLIKEAAKGMRQRRAGSIINITSLAAEQGFPNNVAYVAFKGALKQLTKASALDLANDNVRVNCVGPGYFKTNMTAASWSDADKREQRTQRIPLGRWGEPNDLVGILIFLGSDASSYVTGQSIYIDGGWLAKGL